jgi:hypothetical protein
MTMLIAVRSRSANRLLRRIFGFERLRAMFLLLSVRICFWGTYYCKPSFAKRKDFFEKYIQFFQNNITQMQRKQENIQPEPPDGTQNTA